MGAATDVKILPSILDRLFDSEPNLHDEPLRKRYHSVRDLRQSVAQDLEYLLNSRKIVVSDTTAVDYPETVNSVYSYGMIDFVGLSLLNPMDRDRICRTLELAIELHEPRLKNARVQLEQSNALARGLRFTLHAILQVKPTKEAVSFDATLLPTTQQYQIKHRD